MKIALLESADRRITKCVIAIFVFPMLTAFFLLCMYPFALICSELRGYGLPTLGNLAGAVGCMGALGLSFSTCRGMWPRMPTVLQIKGSSDEAKDLRSGA